MRLDAYRKEYRDGFNPSLLAALERARGFLVKDPKDMVFAILGISKYSAYAVNGEASVNYLQNPEDLYFTVSESILQDQDDLGLLSSVEDHSVRSIQGIPSWVPDWTCPFNAGVGGAERDFKAAGRLVAKDIKVDKHKKVLVVKGIELDLISEIGESKAELAMDSVFPKWLGIVASLDPIYWNGEARSDVFCRALMADALPAEHFGQEFRDSFREWLILHTLKVMSLPSREDLSSRRRLTLDRLMELSQTDDKGTIPSPGDVSFFAKEYPEYGTGHSVLSSKGFHLYFQNSIQTRLFCTKKKYLGLGPQSLQSGDSIWILPGAKTPFTLRQLPHGRKNHFRLVGGTYVHGFMHGEAVAGGRLKFKTIYIE